MKKTLKKKLQLTLQQGNSELGAGIILVYLCLLVFLYIAILFLDIPYIERVGRGIQLAADSAALSGAERLSNRFSTAGPPYVHTDSTSVIRPTREQIWRDSKRAAIGVLKQVTIPAIETSVFGNLPAGFLGGSQDPFDQTDYGHEIYDIGNGVQTGRLQITRGVYQRPGAVFDINDRRFYPVEFGNVWRGNAGDPNQYNCKPGVDNRPTACLSTASVFSEFAVDKDLKCDSNPATCAPATTCCVANNTLFVHNVKPSLNLITPTDGTTDTVYTADTTKPAENGSPPVTYVADSMQVSITINSIPTLISRIFGINNLANISRQAIAGPQ